jgi:hypothetical protein
VFGRAAMLARKGCQTFAFARWLSFFLLCLIVKFKNRLVLTVDGCESCVECGAITYQFTALLFYEPHTLQTTGTRMLADHLLGADNFNVFSLKFIIYRNYKYLTNFLTAITCRFPFGSITKESY